MAANHTVVSDCIPLFSTHVSLSSELDWIVSAECSVSFKNRSTEPKSSSISEESAWITHTVTRHHLHCTIQLSKEERKPDDYYATAACLRTSIRVLQVVFPSKQTSAHEKTARLLDLPFPPLNRSSWILAWGFPGTSTTRSPRTRIGRGTGNRNT